MTTVYLIEVLRSNGKPYTEPKFIDYVWVGKRAQREAEAEAALLASGECIFSTPNKYRAVAATIQD